MTRAQRPLPLAARIILRPAMLLWHRLVREDWDSVAQAMDAPYAFHQGTGLDRVLLLGGHTAAGFGVATHQLGIVGTLSRQLSALTGRATEVEGCADIGMTVRSLLPRVRQLRANNAADFDVVLVAAGINDSLRLTSPKSFEADVRKLVSVVEQLNRRPTPILFIEIPPPRMVWDFSAIPAVIAARHAIALNQQLRGICDGTRLATFVPFAPSANVEELGLDRWRSSMFQEWAERFVTAVATALRASREDFSATTQALDADRS